MRLVFSLCIVVSIFISLFLYVRADEYDDINKQLADLKKSLESSQKATATNEQESARLNKQLQSIRYQVNHLESQIVQKEKEVKEGEKARIYQQELLNQRAFSYYKNAGKNSMSLMYMIVGDDLSHTMENFFYQKSVMDEDKRAILQIATYIKDVQDKKISLEKEKVKLTAIKQEVDKQSQFMAGEVAKAKKYQSELQSKIAQLSARQQQIVAQKLSSLNIPQSAVSTQGGCVDDRTKDPGFSPRFAFFTYGVPNRVGLNQYGAKGRAEAGQNVEEILRAYYDNYELKKDYDTGKQIKVAGKNEYGQTFDTTWDIETYVKHVYEMPTSWHPEALKAQAVAARSYALSYTNEGTKSICPSQSCQVVKQEENTDAWKAAVDATRGWVMISGGRPVTAWFSSTHGGYVFKSGEIGWNDTAFTKHNTDASGSINSFEDLQNHAYDKSSPWFYCDWGSRAEYGNTAWLKSDEIADIVNALKLAKIDSSVQNHLSQVDKPNPDGTDTWDKERVKSELRSRGGTPFNTVDNVIIDWDKEGGRTNTVIFTGDGGSQSFSGAEFKNFFNLRAPSNIQIVGLLFNIEKR